MYEAQLEKPSDWAGNRHSTRGVFIVRVRPEKRHVPAVDRLHVVAGGEQRIERVKKSIVQVFKSRVVLVSAIFYLFINTFCNVRVESNVVSKKVTPRP